MDTNVVVVIVTYNSAHVVVDLLDGLPSALGSMGGEVVVVDNGSTDGTDDLLERRTDCLLVRSTNDGYAAGVNRGIAAASGDGPVLVLNPDVRLSAMSVGALMKALEVPGVGVVAPKILNSTGAVFRSLRREPTLLRATGLGFTGWRAVSEHVVHADDYRVAHAVDWALGAVLMIGRNCLDDVGSWDESYFLYSEETDFCLRARDKGWLTWYEPKAEAIHIGGQSGQNDDTHVMQIVNRVRFYRRRHGVLKSWVYYWLAVFSEITWALRGHRQSLAAIRALLRPRLRPVQLRASAGLMPQ